MTWTGRDQTAYGLGLLMGVPLGAIAYGIGGWYGAAVLTMAFLVFSLHDIWTRRKER